MNKHRGSRFDDYLKERGISEDVSTLAQERWEVLSTETPNALEDTAKASDTSPNHIKRFFHRLRHIFNHLFS